MLSLTKPLLKALDDDELIRHAAASTWVAVFRRLKNSSSFDARSWSAPLEDVFSTLLLHLDDTDEKIYERVGLALKCGGALEPTMLLRQIDVAQTKAREPARCQQVRDQVERAIAVEQAGVATESLSLSDRQSAIGDCNF